jgi:hypothetical protein
MLSFLLCLEWIELQSSAPNDGNAFDIVTGLEAVGAGLGVSVDDEEGNQAFGQADLPADPLQSLTFAIRQFDAALIVDKPIAVRLQQSNRS